MVPVPFSSSLAHSTAQHCFLAHSLSSLSSTGSSSSSLPLVLRAPPMSSSSSFSLSSCQAVPGGSGVATGFDAVLVSLPVAPPVSAPSLFRHFAAVPAAPLLSPLPSSPSALVFLSWSFVVFFCRSSSFSFGSLLRCFV